MAERGAFANEGVRAGEVSDVEYLQLSGRYPPGRARVVKRKQVCLMQPSKALKTHHCLSRADKPYISQARPNLINFESRYDHLARVDEWRANMRGRRHMKPVAQASASAWVSANAGSGKTYVLVTRLVALMLSGVAPEKLCV